MTCTFKSHLITGRLLRAGQLCLLLAISASPVAGVSQDAATLRPGTMTEREIRGGEIHSFQVQLSAGEFLYLVVEQKGVDVVVTMLAPNGQPLARSDCLNGRYGAEPVAIVAETSGAHRLEVSSPDKQAPAGRYAVRLVTVHAATPDDRAHAAAEKAFEEAQKLRSQRTAAGLRAAIEKYGEALPFYQSSGDREREAMTLYSIGNCHANAGEFRQALESLGRALPLFQALGDRRMEATTLNFSGGAWDILGDLPRAQEYYSQALTLARATGDQYAEAALINNIGKISFDLAEWQKAVDNFTLALGLYRALGNRRSEALALDNIGVAYFALGELDKALEFHQQALPLRQAAGDRTGEAFTRQRIGIVHARTGEIEKALAQFSHALPLQRAAGDRQGEAYTLDFTGQALAARREYEKALEALEQSLQLRRALEDRRGKALSLGNLGDLQAAMGQPQKALEYYRQALALFRVIGDRHYEASMLQGIARAERDSGHPAEARQQIEAALTLFEEARARVRSQQLRASYFAARQNAYQFYIDLLMQLHRLDPAAGYDSAALRASERARARSLLELLSEARVDFRQGADQALLGREQELMRQINSRAARLTQRNTAEQLTALKKEISELENDYQQVEAAIRQNNPRYAAVTQPQPLGLREIQQLLDADTLLLEYSLGQERSFLWIVTKDSLTTHELPKGELVNEAARNVYSLLTARSLTVKGETPPQRQARITEADAQLPAAAHALSQMILAPAASQLGSRRLLIVADGALQYVPFAMLPEPSVVSSQLSVAGRSATQKQVTTDNQPLIVSHEIISLPSASTLEVMRRELAGRQPAPKLLAVIADPVFSIDDERNRTRTLKISDKSATAARIIEHEDEKAGQMKQVSGLKVPRLPFTRQEADQILAIAPKTDSFRAVDFRASRATAMSAELSRYRYLHFATHGYLDSEHPNFSALVLSLVDEQGRAQDGFLRANEIFNLNLPAELVVLSACQTGLGKEVKGEGLVGLTRGFMYAGAKRVIVSLWNVNDKATSELMTQLYRQMLRSGETPAAALRRAQLALWKQKQWQAPCYWAAFILQGEWK
ncbi:MAG TPA: CHAT domain-containing tetratricopeptide repeat protein [Blastocatellia bacterium]|nr:CHAT domain-containing tetratricopeptide repeat protein [Blastocatellia bacterium]